MISNSRFRTFALSSMIAIMMQPQLLPVRADDSQGSTIQTEAPAPRREANPSRSDEVNLKGVISVYEGPSPDQLVGSLVGAALSHDKEAEALTLRNQKMHDPLHKFLQGAKIAANFVSEYRGFEMSSEGADVILGDKLRLKSVSSTEYATQKKADELHAKVFSSLLQMGQGLGESDPATQEKSVAAGYEPLRNMVGPEAADQALNTLKAWSNQVTVPNSILNGNPWTVMDLQNKTEDLVKNSAKTDPVMDLARRALRRYNTHSKFSLGGAKAVNIVLSVGMFSPTIFAPMAEIMLFVFQMSTGGPEDYKLLTELYLDKRMESRWKRLNQESAQAVNAYNNAILTKNPVLLGLSESFISVMGGEETSSRIVGNHRLVARRSTHDDAIDCLQTHGTDM